MDFHSLTRRELQSLCKLNKIPANITNVAMADALRSLQTVEGIEEFLKVSQSETNCLVESMENVEAPSPKAPQTRCRTTTRQKVKVGETENLPPTANRTTRRGSKQLAGDVEESKNNIAKTPAMPTTRRKALATSSCRNVNNQLNECEEEAKKESTVQKAYSTRRSTRLTEKKSAEPKVQKESGKAVKMNSFVDEMDESMDEVNVTSEEVGKFDEVLENTVGSGKSNAEVEDICHAFEKLDVLIEESAPSSVIEKAVDIEVTHKTVEEKDCGELDNLNLESSDETPNPSEEGDSEEKLEIEEEFDLGEKVSSEEEAKNNVVSDQKTELDSISTPSEDDDSEEEIDFGENFDDSEVSTTEISGDNLSAAKDQEIEMAQEEDSVVDNNGSLESGDEEIGVDATAFNTENFSGPQELQQEQIFSAVTDMKDEDLENNGCSSMVSDMIFPNVENPNEASESDNFSTVDEITTMDTEQVAENKVDEALDVIPTVDNVSTITAEAQDLKPKLFTEFREFPNKRTHSKTPTSFKNTSLISDDKENMESGRKLQNVFVDEGKKSKKEKDENENDKVKSLHEISMRQLRKQVKALTLKNLNANENAASKEATTRPALQVLCENQLVGGETMK